MRLKSLFVVLSVHLTKSKYAKFKIFASVYDFLAGHFPSEFFSFTIADRGRVQPARCLSPSVLVSACHSFSPSSLLSRSFMAWVSLGSLFSWPAKIDLNHWQQGVHVIGFCDV